METLGSFVPCAVIEQQELCKDSGFIAELTVLASRISATNKRTIFISRAWPLSVAEDKFNEQWSDLFARRLAEHLQALGFSVILDVNDLGIGVHLNSAMQQSVNTADHILLIITQTYLHKITESPDSGVAIEFSYIKERIRLMGGGSEAGKQRFVLPFALTDNLTGFPLAEGHAGFAAVYVNQMGYRNTLLDFSHKLCGLARTSPLMNRHGIFQGVLQAPEHWNVPHHNEFFTGRNNELKIILEKLEAVQDRVMQVKLCGLPGMGKTQIVKRFAHDHRRNYRLIWWINAETQIQLEESYLSLAAKLGIARQGKSFSQIRDEIKEYLRNYKNWLLIFDNVEMLPEKLQEYLPEQHTDSRGHILITSRKVTVWPGAINLGRFTLEDAVNYLLTATNQADRVGAEKLARRLGRFPLALAHAAAYITALELSFDEYFDLYNQKHPELEKEHEDLESAAYTDYYHRTVRAAFQLVYEKIKDNPAALDLLYFCCFLAPDNIPKFLVEHFIESRQHPFSKALKVLIKYAVVQRDKTFSSGEHSSHIFKDSYSLHRLIQDFIYEQIVVDQKPVWVQRCLDSVSVHFRPQRTDAVLWQRAGELITHVDMLLEWVDRHRVEGMVVPAREMTSRAMDYCLARDLLDIAAKNFARMAQYVQGLDAQNLEQLRFYAHYLNKWVSLCVSKRASAEEFSQVFAKIDETFSQNYWGILENDPAVLELNYSLGLALLEHGQFLEKSKVLFLKALNIAREKNDVNVELECLCNLGTLCDKTGEFKEALEFLNTALKLHERTGYSFPNIGYVYNAIGKIYRDERFERRDVEMAQKYFLDSIEECKRFPGISKAARFAAWAHYNAAWYFCEHRDAVSAQEHNEQFVQNVNTIFSPGTWPLSYTEHREKLEEALRTLQAGKKFGK